MKVPGKPSYSLPSETFLSGLGRSLGKFSAIDDATRKKQQSKNDRVAKMFLDDLYGYAKLTHKFGQGTVKRLAANALVTIGEGSLLSGISQRALISAAQNVFKLQDVNSFPLLVLADLAGRETIIAYCVPWRDSYQDCVKVYIQDCIKDEHQQIFIDLCKNYFDMSNDEAKYFEASIHVIVEYFRMYPPKPTHKEEEEKDKAVFPTSKISLKNLDPITLAAWTEAVNSYEREHLSRKNDALPRRVRDFLAWVSGTPYSELEKNNQNLSRDLKTTQEEDLPKLKELYPDLPELDKMTGK